MKSRFLICCLMVAAALFFVPEQAEAGCFRGRIRHGLGHVAQGVGRVISAPVRFFRNGGFFRRGCHQHQAVAAPSCNCAPCQCPTCAPCPVEAKKPQPERSILPPKKPVDTVPPVNIPDAPE